MLWNRNNKDTVFETWIGEHRRLGGRYRPIKMDPEAMGCEGVDWIIGGHILTQRWTFRFHVGPEISWVAELLLASLLYLRGYYFCIFL
jgi:hypothetical protein